MYDFEAIVKNKMVNGGRLSKAFEQEVLDGLMMWELAWAVDDMRFNDKKIPKGMKKLIKYYSGMHWKAFLDAWDKARKEITD